MARRGNIERINRHNYRHGGSSVGASHHRPPRHRRGGSQGGIGAAEPCAGFSAHGRSRRHYPMPRMGGVDVSTGSTAFSPPVSTSPSLHTAALMIVLIQLFSIDVALRGLRILQGAADPSPPDASGGYPSSSIAGHCAPIWCAKRMRKLALRFGVRKRG